MKMKFMKIFVAFALVISALMGAVEASINSIVLESPETVSAGSKFQVKAVVNGNGQGARVTLDLPNGLKATSPVSQELGTFSDKREYTWDVIAHDAGAYSVSAYATDSSSYKYTHKRLIVEHNSFTITTSTSASAVKQNEWFTITGTVRDRNGIVSGAKIEIRLAGNVWDTTTNDQGAFSANIVSASKGTNNILIYAKKDALKGSANRQIAVTSGISGATPIPAATVSTAAATVSPITTPGTGFLDVIVKSYSGDRPIKAKITFTNGQEFNLNSGRIALPAGTYGITVEADGFKKEIRNVYVNGNGTALAAFSLKEDDSKSSSSKDTIASIGTWVLWISALASVLILAISFYSLRTRNPIKSTERF